MACSYYIFHAIPGQHSSYTVAVLATGLTDARTYMRRAWRGGKLSSTITQGKVNADCGAVTEAAGEVIHESMKGITW